MQPLKQPVMQARRPPSFDNVQEPLSSPVVAWEILCEDCSTYHSVQIGFYDT